MIQCDFQSEFEVVIPIEIFRVLFEILPQTGANTLLPVDERDEGPVCLLAPHSLVPQ